MKELKSTGGRFISADEMAAMNPASDENNIDALEKRLSILERNAKRV